MRFVNLHNADNIIIDRHSAFCGGAGRVKWCDLAVQDNNTPKSQGNRVNLPCFGNRTGQMAFRFVNRR
jgi:hypothetical protein